MKKLVYDLVYMLNVVTLVFLFNYIAYRDPMLSGQDHWYT